jgi:polyphosphate kinase
VKGLSENIEVLSIIGRFLEHSRIFYFASGNENPVAGDFFIGSADWMHRNLHNRVELITPILETKLKEKLWDFFEVMLKDNRQAWYLNENGSYSQRSPRPGETEISTHFEMMNHSLHKDKS